MSYPTEYLIVNGVTLPTNPDDGDVWLASLAPLRATADRVGEITRMPYRRSSIFYPHRDTHTELVLALFIAGTDWADQDDNENTIRTGVVGTHAEDGSILTVPFVWHRNNGEVWTSRGLVRGLYEPEIDNENPPTLRYNLPVVVDAGWSVA